MSWKIIRHYLQFPVAVPGSPGYVTYALLRRLPLSVNYFPPKGSIKDFSLDLHA